ncbi:hypothetical protein BJ322DRAFT_1052283 [Thelephora terrestris]|uniref:Armadillo-like helical domain-containing protein n=1 Tax=Thelephora terrestris TaxID=56493 RepID=A0A9P6HHE6_9AGAM|nr:hypothetical protein BJ322DRAFT_1052283 [Thelephora terrestris]
MDALPQPAVKFIPKYVTLWSRVFLGLAPGGTIPTEVITDAFWANLLSLDVDYAYLYSILNNLSRDECVGRGKAVLHLILEKCLTCARTMEFDDPRKIHALETFSATARCILAKNLGGWEVMTVFAGDVGQSDKFFMGLISAISDCICDGAAATELKHSALQLALVLVSGLAQLSPGAYFLRTDLFPAIVDVILGTDTQKYTFEAITLLALLANFHKSDAAHQNPYIAQIKQTQSCELLQAIAWAANFAVGTVVKQYQELSDDTPPCPKITLGSIVTMFKPDRVFTDPPKGLFAKQPIEAAAVLLPVFEFLDNNKSFADVLVKPFTQEDDSQEHVLVLSLVTASSYILTHATSSASPRAVAYAHLSLNILLRLVQNPKISSAFCQPRSRPIRLCRQRIPLLPIVTGPRPPMCAVLDSCVLWLRHNLHKKLEVNCYTVCIRICHQMISFLQKHGIRLEYHWIELWRAILGLLEFLTKKIGELQSAAGIRLLINETLSLLDLSITTSQAFLPSAKVLHEFVYELTRSSSILKSQDSLLKKPELAGGARERGSTISGHTTSESLTVLVNVVEFYETKIGHTRSANQALRTVAQEIDKDGLQGVEEGRDLEIRSAPVNEVAGLLRYVYADSMSLMP